MSKILPTDFITDHALVRYLERVHGVDVEQARQRIAEDTKHAVETGAAALKKDGLRYIFKGGKVITVLLSKNEFSRLKQLRTGEGHD